jgi:methionyl-tRNA formyltransferase
MLTCCKAAVHLVRVQELPAQLSAGPWLGPLLPHHPTASALSPWRAQVSAVVSQPGRPKGRGNKKVPQPSEVEQLALASGLQPHQILCPEKATDKQFLETLRQLGPDLCITAAYGNYLPTTFLAIPTHGTLNIHPSLLPKYRGAAPVQRALQVRGPGGAAGVGC